MIRTTVHGLVAGALVALVCSPMASAQVAPNDPADGARSTELDAFFARHGDGWKVAVDVAANKPTFVWGKRIPHQGATPRTDVEFAAAALAAVDSNADVFGFDSRELKLNRVEFLDLAQFGSSDKVAVSFDQVVDGIPVVSGHVSVLFDRLTGDVLGLDTTGVPGASAIDLIPSGTLDAAIAAANVAYQQKLGAPALSVDDVTMGVMGPSIHWGRKNPLAERGATLVYVLEMSSPGFLSLADVPAQARVYVSAEGDATVFHVEATAHAAITGNASGHTNTGGETNTTTNQETVPLPFMHVRNGSAGGAILATTDESGNFSIAGNGPTNLFFELRGPYVNVNNGQAADSSFTINGATNAAPVNVVFNPSNLEFPSGEMAAFHWVNQFRLWVKSIDAADTSMDFQVVADVNQNSVAGITTCNAVWVGNAIQFLKTGGGCQNTSYRPVLLHEEGHWANDVYNNDSGMSGAFHEGNADAWAYTITDSPCLDSFLGSGCLRSALQTSVKKCSSDGSESCNGGEVHTEGEALASAIWKVRSNLNTTYGNATGDALHSALFLSWMQSFNDKVIVNVIQDHWLALDDDNGNLSDGTPNFTDITTGFAAYNWPTIALPDLAFTSVVGPAQNASLSPFQGNLVTASITSILGSVASAQVRYSVNGGAFTNLAMAPTGNPNEWSALIPGQANQTSVRWYVHATGSSGSQLDTPAAGANGPNVYHHGLFVQLAFYNFEAGTDEGWTHVNLSGSNGDQWQRNNPAASNEPTDPDAAFSGSRVWGTDVSATGTDGKYEPSSSGELRSPTLQLQRFVVREAAVQALARGRRRSVRPGVGPRERHAGLGESGQRRPARRFVVEPGARHLGARREQRVGPARVPFGIRRWPRVRRLEHRRRDAVPPGSGSRRLLRDLWRGLRGDRRSGPGAVGHGRAGRGQQHHDQRDQRQAEHDGHAVARHGAGQRFARQRLHAAARRHDPADVDHAAVERSGRGVAAGIAAAGHAVGRPVHAVLPGRQRLGERHVLDDQRSADAHPVI
jgi:hypothetical protein